MSAEQGARARRLAVPLAAVMLLAGCASMPDEGNVREVELSDQQDDPQTMVDAMPPETDALPARIVYGFLEAMTSDEREFQTARKYLTKEFGAAWTPGDTAVLAEEPEAMETAAEGEGAVDRKAPDSIAQKTAYVEVGGTQLAWVKSKTSAYEPVEDEFRQTVKLVKEKGQWRIAEWPFGPVLGEENFQRIYQPVNTYFLLEDDGGKDVLVAEPVHVRRGVSPLNNAVSSLLAGPGAMLEDVVQQTFPEDTRLAGKAPLVPDERSGLLTVRLNTEPKFRPQPAECKRMAAQIWFTAQSDQSVGLKKLALQRKDGTLLCEVNSANVKGFDPKDAAQANDHEGFYYIDVKHRLRKQSSELAAAPVKGPFGEGKKDIRSVAVSRDEREAAGVTKDGRELYVSNIENGNLELGDPVFTSRSKKKTDGLTAPSWDGVGNLWVANRVADTSQLYRLKDGLDAEAIDVHGLGSRRIEAVRVAAEGARIALLVEEDGKTSLQLGAIEREGEGEEAKLVVNKLHPVAPQMENVTAVSWAGASELVVAGQKPKGVPQLWFVETDGSAVEMDEASLTGAASVAASEDGKNPLAAVAQDGLVRLPGSGPDWKKIDEDGTAPVYPG